VNFLFDHDVPDDLSYLLQQLGHHVSLLRQSLPRGASDPQVFQFAYENDFLLVTCNHGDFLELAKANPHHGIIIVIRRKTRAAEKSALFRLLERAGEEGLKNNINFA
jgi:predicted nuclease of predicted toxin-antitoxin system